MNSSDFVQNFSQIQCSAEAVFLRHCHTHFEYDAAKKVPVGHLVHFDFLIVENLWEILMPKITLFLSGIPIYL